MVYQEVTSSLQNPLARERKEVIETDLESVVLILGSKQAYGYFNFTVV